MMRSAIFAILMALGVAPGTLAWAYGASAAVYAGGAVTSPPYNSYG